MFLISMFSASRSKCNLRKRAPLAKQQRMEKIEGFIEFLTEIGPRQFERGLVAKDVGEYSRRVGGGILYPKNKHEVRDIVRAANLFNVSIHPISQGHNWGFGSRKAPKSNAVILDLRGFDSIDHIDLEDGMALVEPGVSQYQLAAALNDSEWMLNVSAAGKGASIIGNALENGLGFWGPRSRDLAGLEVLLGNGELAYVGDYPAKESSPTLKLGDFIQTNLGIVLSGVVRLVRRSESVFLVRASTSTNRVFKLIDDVCRLQNMGVLGGVPKIWRLDDKLELTAIVNGDEDDIEDLKSLCKKHLDEYQKCKIYMEEEIMSLPLRSIWDCYHGMPNDHVIQTFFNVSSVGAQVDEQSLVGVKILTLGLTPKKASLESAESILGKISLKPNVDIQSTYNVLGGREVALVVYVKFARSQEGIKHATVLHSQLIRDFKEAGFSFRRMDIDNQQSKFSSILKLPRNFDALKRRCDPKGIISPGRYTGRRS